MGSQRRGCKVTSSCELAANEASTSWSLREDLLWLPFVMCCSRKQSSRSLSCCSSEINFESKKEYKVYDGLMVNS